MIMENTKNLSEIRFWFSGQTVFIEKECSDTDSPLAK